jgi:hypothetical protein
VIGWLSQCGNDAIEVARQGYNHELYRRCPSLFLQRADSENSPQNCGAATDRTVPKSPSAEKCNVKGAILR